MVWMKGYENRRQITIESNFTGYDFINNYSVYVTIHPAERKFQEQVLKSRNNILFTNGDGETCLCFNPHQEYTDEEVDRQIQRAHKCLKHNPKLVRLPCDCTEWAIDEGECGHSEFQVRQDAPCICEYKNIRFDVLIPMLEPVGETSVYMYYGKQEEPDHD